MKRWLIFICIIILITLFFGQIYQSKFNDCGISSISKYEDICKLNCGIKYVFGINEEDEKFIYHSLTKYEENYIDDVNNSDIIIIGESTGKYKVYGGSFCQEIKVNTILKGNEDEIKENDIINMYSTDGFVINNYDPLYNNIKNIMLKDTKYLIFLNCVELNKYTKEKAYRSQGGYFSYLQLTDSIDYPITKTLEDIKFNELQDLEYFATSERILRQIYRIKQKIIDKYL